MERPVVRATSPKVSMRGLSYRQGEEFFMTEWPKPYFGQFEPVNDAARRLLAYYDAYKYAPLFPADLMGPDGLAQLPAHPGSSWRNPPPAEADPAPAHWPRYRLSHPVVLGGVEHAAGKVIIYRGWPSFAMQPVNAVARRIADYLRRHEDDERRSGSPWCCARDAEYLPEPRASTDPRPIVTPELPEPRQRVRRARTRGAVPRLPAA